METFFDWISRRNINNSEMGELARIIVSQIDRTATVKNNIVSWHQCLTQLKLPDEIHQTLDKAWLEYSKSFS